MVANYSGGPRHGQTGALPLLVFGGRKGQLLQVEVQGRSQAHIQAAAIMNVPIIPPFFAASFPPAPPSTCTSTSAAAGLPLETIWTDIDHMDKWRDFTFDPELYPLEEMQVRSCSLPGVGCIWE